MKIYLLDTHTLNIIAEASNYEAIYDLMNDEFKDVDCIVSPNPTIASLFIWKENIAKRDTNDKAIGRITNTL